MPLLLKRKDEEEKLKNIKNQNYKTGSDIYNVYIYISKRDLKKKT